MKKRRAWLMFLAGGSTIAPSFLLHLTLVASGMPVPIALVLTVWAAVTIIILVGMGVRDEA